MSAFERALSLVLVHEGGYVNHPQDPGGATNKGVTQRVYDDFRARMGQTKQSVRLIADSEINAIYYQSYWTLARCERLPPAIAYVVFDGAVNSGVKQSAKWLQRALGVRDDGLIGPTTINAAAKAPEDVLIITICETRLRFLKSLKTWKMFGIGWARRVSSVKDQALAWDDSQPRASAYSASGQGAAKAVAVDAKKAPHSALGDLAAGGGFGVGGVSAILDQTKEQLTPLSYGSELIGKIVAGLVIVSAILTIGGIGYGLWARYRKAEIKDALQTEAT